VSISALVQLTETPDGHSGLEVMARVARVVPLALAAPSAGALALRNHLALILGGVRFCDAARVLGFGTIPLMSLRLSAMPAGGAAIPSGLLPGWVAAALRASLPAFAFATRRAFSAAFASATRRVLGGLHFCGAACLLGGLCFCFCGAARVLGGLRFFGAARLLSGLCFCAAAQLSAPSEAGSLAAPLANPFSTRGAAIDGRRFFRFIDSHHRGRGKIP
jgi:hypothetical protein